ncbi:oxalurate catabolism protein HpxZ [Methylobacterium sp. J-088]|uniref:oxalurate catabolism protein HpxZ n=1 Tax=Methylobacterium sp. J-088 TaxID=2836664 RepID=UPI001FBA3328|nr:oxalurate catabolism protein HpxZ [Methylobacterium sp. J-088]MCJ2063002.1 oxalurate catabolism protein HpxZ [Methylobacterium sp. J-088]
MDVTVNRPEIVAEIAALFERYEQALVEKDVAVLDATFWDSPHTIRYALTENCYGFAEIHAARVAADPPLGGTKEARIRLEILTLGSDFATVNFEFKPRGKTGIGRQSQTWMRLPGLGWKVVSAHVSILPIGS